MRSVAVFCEDSALCRLIALEAEQLGMRALCNQGVTALRDCQVAVVDCRGIARERMAKAVALPIPVIGILPQNAEAAMDTPLDACLYMPLSLVALRDALLQSMEVTPTYQAEEEEQTHILWKSGTRVLLPEGGSVTLSEREMRVLCCLCEHVGETVSIETLQTLLGDHQSNMANVYVCHLRRKLERAGEKRILLTVRGKGYMTRYRLEEIGSGE